MLGFQKVPAPAPISSPVSNGGGGSSFVDRDRESTESNTSPASFFLGAVVVGTFSVLSENNQRKGSISGSGKASEDFDLSDFGFSEVSIYDRDQRERLVLGVDVSFLSGSFPGHYHLPLEAMHMCSKVVQGMLRAFVPQSQVASPSLLQPSLFILPQGRR